MTSSSQTGSLEKAVQDSVVASREDARPQPEAGVAENLQAALTKRCYVLSEQHLSGYRVTIGFETLKDAQAAHDAIARSGR